MVALSARSSQDRSRIPSRRAQCSAGRAALRRQLPALVIVLMTMAGHVWAQTGDTVKSKPGNGFSPDALGISGPKIVTQVVGLEVKVKAFHDVLNVSDLDIYVDKKGERYVPLLRLLRLLNAKGGIKNKLVTFSVSTGQKAQIDLGRDALIVGSHSQTVKVVSGVSDLTGKAELYVPEGLLKTALGLDYSWDDQNFAYTVTAPRTLRLFQQIVQQHHRQRAIVHSVSSDLVETQGMQTPQGSRQLISMIDASLRVDGWRNSNLQPKLFSVTRPEVKLYGQIAGGNYHLDLYNNVVYPPHNLQRSGALGWPTWIKKGQWTYGSANTTARVGDSVLGLSRLVFPSSLLSGVVVQGMLGSSDGSDVKSRFLRSNHFTFMNQKHFSGYAPLGSTVNVYVNGRLADSTTVDETPGAPPGQGQYNISAAGLSNDVLNEVRVVVIQPDGTRDEHIENVVGSSALLPKGVSAYAFGVGTKRYVSNYSSQTYGALAGGGYYYGLTPNATIGISLATQNDYAPNFGVSTGQAVTPRLGARSYVGQTLAYRFLGNFIFREEEAMNYVHQTGDTPLATSLGLDYMSRPFALSTYVFNFGQNYSSGTVDISNRRGFAVFGAPHVDGIDIGAAWAHIRQVSGNHSEDYLVSQASIPITKARTQTFVRFDHMVNKNDPLSSSSYENLAMYTFGLQTGPWMSTTFRANYGAGDRISPISAGDLRYGVDIPLITSVPTFGTVIAADHILNNYSRLNLIYRKYDKPSESAEVDYSRTPGIAGDINMTLRYRRYLTTARDYAQLNLEYPFDQQGRYALGMNVNYSGFTHSASYDVYLTMRNLFFYDHGHFGLVRTARQIDPQAGGLKGRVYLDANANGRYDEGEPGVPGVQVLVDGQTRYTSGPAGYFFVGRRSYEDQAVVELDENSLPAIYTPTQGRQRATWENYVFTRVYLGVAVLDSVSGRIAEWRNGEVVRPLPGVVVKAVRVKDGSVVNQSITDSGGVYYLGQLKPGSYKLELDKDSVPPALQVQGQLPQVTLPVSTKPTDLQDVDIRLVSKH